MAPRQLRDNRTTPDGKFPPPLYHARRSAARPAGHRTNCRPRRANRPNQATTTEGAMSRHRTTCKFLLSTFLAVLFTLCLHVSEASARRVVYVYRYYPPPEKAGLFMMNFRGGPVFGIQNYYDQTR